MLNATRIFKSYTKVIREQHRKLSNIGLYLNNSVISGKLLFRACRENPLLFKPEVNT